MKKLVIVLLSLLIAGTTLSINSVSVKGNDHFETMKYRWRENAVGNLEDKMGLSDNKYISNYISTLSNQSQTVYGEMNLGVDRSSLWSRRSNEQKSAHLTRNFQNLAIIAKSYGTPGTALYKDKNIKEQILSGLEFLVNVEKYNGEAYYGNWWDWQIGIPVEFLNILFVMEQEIEIEDFNQYVNVLSLYVPNPYKQMVSFVGQENFRPIQYTANNTTGANRADLAHSVVGIGILKKDAKLIKTALDSLPEIFEIKANGEGFHEDGMFLFHRDTPYIGSYGVSLFKSVASILSVVANTPYDMKEDIKLTFIKLVNDSTLPFVNKGKFVGMVEGRSISRPSNHTENARGSAIVKTLSLSSQIGTDQYSQNMFKAVKYWVNQDPEYYVSTTKNYEELKSIVNVIETEVNLEGFVPFNGAKVFPTGDRFVYSDLNTYIGISMYSSRISAYTVGNRENYQGWHLSDGFVYMMNDDKQFGKSYWPTVDYYRLPGTTVDTRALANATDDWTSYNSKSDWAGGTNSSKNASVGMILDKNGYKNNKVDVGMNLIAKKSWFMLDGNLVSLGSNINGTSDSTIETIVENKLLDSQYNYKLLDSKGQQAGENLDLKVGDTLLLESSESKNNIGYQFLNDMKLTNQIVRRTGGYSLINGGVNDAADTYTEDYQMLIQNYGKNAVNQSYAYVQTQGITSEALAANKDRFKILQQNDTAHIVEDTKTLTTAANIWSNNGAQVKNVKTNTNASLLIEEKAFYTDYFISDPSHKTQSITVTITQQESQEIILSKNVKQISETEFVIDTSKSNGSTASIRFVLPVDKVDLQELGNQLINMDTTGLTPYSQLMVKKETDKVVALLNQTNASFEAVQEAITSAKLVLETVDELLNLDFVSVLINEIEHLNPAVYTESTWDQLSKELIKLKDAKAQYDVFAPLKISNEKVQEIYANTKAKMTNLVYKKDTLNLKNYNKAVDLSTSIKQENYSKLSYGLIKVKLADLKQYRNNNLNNQETLDSKSIQLINYIKKMEVKK